MFVEQSISYASVLLHNPVSVALGAVLVVTGCDSGSDSSPGAPDASETDGAVDMPERISVGQFPNGIAANSQNVFVVRGSRHGGVTPFPAPAGELGSVEVFSALNGSLIKSIDVPAGGHALRMTPDGSEIYVAHFSMDRIVTSISTDSLEVSASIGGQQQFQLGVPDSLAISSDGRHVYVGSNGHNDTAWISRIDTATHALDPDWRVDVAGGNVCWVEVVGDAIYANSWTGGTVQRMSISAERLDASHKVGDFPHAVAPVGDVLYALVSGGNRVVKLDSTTLGEMSEIVGPWAGNWGGPVSAQLSLSQRSLFVANHAMNGVAVIDVDPSSSSYESVTNTILVEDDPIFMALSENGETLYVANNESSTISIVDVSAYP